MSYMNLWICAILSAMTLVTGCGGDGDASKGLELREEIIRGRGIEGRRVGIYTMSTPRGWIRRDPLPDDLVTDTTKSICEFIINDPEGIIRIAVHNFPAETIDARIPPQAQVARWKNQIEGYDEMNSYTSPIAFAGYSGLLFVGIGTNMVIAAALQLTPEHFRNLPVLPPESKETSRTSELHAQMRGDVTIKAVGTIGSMQKHQDEILRSIHSFALVDEIPHPR